MSYSIRMRRCAYDNLLHGTVASREVHTGSAGSTEVLARETLVAGTASARTTDCLDHILTATTARTTGFTNETMENTN